MKLNLLFVLLVCLSVATFGTSTIQAKRRLHLRTNGIFKKKDKKTEEKRTEEKVEKEIKELTLTRDKAQETARQANVDIEKLEGELFIIANDIDGTGKSEKSPVITMVKNKMYNKICKSGGGGLPNITCSRTAKPCTLKDKCLFEEDFGVYPQLYASTCVQVDLAMPYLSSIHLHTGLNLEYTSSTECFKWKKKGDPCTHSITGTFGIGMELQDPVTHSSFGSVVYQGSLDISSDDIQPCMFNVTSGMPSFSWECGYWRLFKAYMVNTFTRGGLFKSKQFTREMFKRVTRTKAELNTEKNKAEADNELLTLVTQLSNTGVTQQVPFAPQMHPLYRIGRVYNLIYFGHYKKMLEDLGKLGQLPRHPFIRNYKKYKKNPEKIKPDFIKIEDTLPKGEDEDGVSKEDSYYNTLKDIGGLVNYEKVKLKMLNNAVEKENAWKKEKDLSKLMSIKTELSKKVHRMQILFLWYTRYLLDTAVMTKFGENIERKTTKGEVAKKFGWTGTNKIGLNKAHKTMSMEHCSSLNVYYNGVIRNQVGKDSGYGAENAGKDYTFRGRPQFLCTMAKDISSLPYDDYKHHNRKECKLDLKAEACKGKNKYGCKVCLKNAEGKKEEVLQCNRILVTQTKYEEKMGKDGLVKECALLSDDGSISSNHSTSLFFNDETKEMVYQIPLASANMFPYLTKLSVETMRKYRNLRSEVEKNGYKFGQMKQALDIWTNFEKNVKSSIETISTDFTKNFGVMKAKEVDKVCESYPAGTCTKAESYDKIITGKALKITQEHIDKIDKAAADVEGQFQQAAEDLKYPEVIKYTTSHALSATLWGGTAGFCTPDGNQVQVTYPYSKSGVYDPKNHGNNAVFEGTEAGIEVLYRPNPAVPLYMGISKIVTTEAPFLELSLKYTPVTEWGANKVTLPKSPMPNLQFFQDAFLSPKVFENLEYLIYTVMPMYEKVLGSCGGNAHKPLKMVTRGLLAAEIKKLYGYNIKSPTQMFKKIMEARSTAPTDLGDKYRGDSFSNTPAMSIDLKWKVYCGGTAGLASYFGNGKGIKSMSRPRLTLNFLNVNEWVRGIPGSNMKIKPMLGLGISLDMGALFNSVARMSSLYFEQAENSQSVALDLNTGNEIVTDLRSKRCKECCKHIRPMFVNGAKAPSCTAGNADEREECKFVKSDINDFLSTTRVKNADGKRVKLEEILQNGVKNNAELRKIGALAEAKCIGVEIEYCAAALTCRSMGLACAQEGSAGFADGGAKDVGAAEKLKTMDEIETKKGWGFKLFRL
jgi:hypothetical protein